MKKLSNFRIAMLLFFLTVFINGADTVVEMNSKKAYYPVTKPGIDVLLEKRLDLVANKRVGLITNPTGVTASLKSTIDALDELPDVNLAVLFGPEHGVRGDVPGGKPVPKYRDPKTGIMVYSLYGNTRRPTPAMLKNIEVLLYDIQDIGIRPYTYIYTMAYAMEAAKEANIPFIVLDRPNPLGGIHVAGNVLDPKFRSFVGLYPIPYIYGMTVGEIARLFNQEFKIDCDLTVVPMEGWRRDMTFDQTGLCWIPTSPHVPHAETAYFVAAVGGIGELMTVSTGVGYSTPFELIGAPWMDGERLASELNARGLPGVFFRPIYFRPYYFLFADQQCSGVQIHLLDKNKFQPIAAQIHILTAIQKLYPDQKIFNTSRTTMFDRAFGTDQVRKAILRGEAAGEIIASWHDKLEQFKKIRQKYLIYR